MNLTLLNWGLLAALLACSFLLSGMEAGVFALSRLRIRQLTRTGQRSPKVLQGFLDHPENFLWTIFVGNTLVNFVILGLAVAWLHGWFAGRVGIFALLFALVVFLFYALFDLLPKMLFRRFPNRLCLFSAVPFSFLHVGLRPLVGLVEWASQRLLTWTGGTVFSGHLFGNREELRLVMQESAQVLTSEERGMVNRVLDLQTLTVRQVATPIAHTVTVEATATVREVLDRAREQMFSRLPVWEGRAGGRRITGLVSVEAMLFRPDLDTTRAVGTLVEPALFLNEETRLEVALRRMQRGGQRLAIVLGPDHRENGVVSLEDILKVVFGEVKL